MKVRDIMTSPAITVAPEESVEVAARTLARYQIGALPVCRRDGSLCGMVTDRDLVLRCLAAGRVPAKTTVEQVMTGRVYSVSPDMESAAAARYMGREQLRRLPVTVKGKLCGILSLGDFASREDCVMDAAEALSDHSGDILERLL